MFRTISDLMPADPDYPERTHRLMLYRQILEGKFYGNAVVLQTGYCEGVYIDNPLVVAVDYLMLQSDETKWPGYANGRAMLLGLWISNGEVNVNLGALQIANVTDGFVSNLDITRDLGPNTAQTFFGFLNVSNFNISGCNFVGGPSGGTSQDIAFQFRSSANSSGNIIAGCHFEDMATIIQIIGPNGTVGLTSYGLHTGNVPISTAFIDATPIEASNYISFISPSSLGAPASVALVKDFVLSGGAGNVIFRVNNVLAASNFIRHQPSPSANSPILCFDGQDSTVSGIVQTKGGNLTISAGGTAGNGNLADFLNVLGATGWVVLQNATAGNLSVLTTNTGGLGVQPKGSLWLTPGGGLFLGGLPTSKPVNGSGQIWNNSGNLSIA